MGMLNAIGLQNPGVDKVVDEILPGLDFTETRFFANVSGSTIEEYVRVTKRFDDSPIDAIACSSTRPRCRPIRFAASARCRSFRSTTNRSLSSESRSARRAVMRDS